MNSQRQKSEWWLPGAGGGRNEKLAFNSYGVSIWEKEKILKMDGGEDYTTV